MELSYMKITKIQLRKIIREVIKSQPAAPFGSGLEPADLDHLSAEKEDLISHQ
jgi:hypothetical protein